MATQRITARIPVPQRRRARTATALAGVAFLIAAGGYAATITLGPDAYHARRRP